MNQHLHDLIDELEAKVVAELHHLEDAVRAEFGDLVARFRHHANETAPQAAQDDAGSVRAPEASHQAAQTHPAASTTLTFDPSAHPDAGERAQALAALRDAHPLGTRIVDPQGNDVDVRGNSILPAAAVDETTLELGAVGDGRHPRVDVSPGGFVDKAFGPYAAGTKFIVRTVGDLAGGGPGTKVRLEVRKDGTELAAGEGDFRCEAQSDPALAAEDGVRYVARIINRDEKPISCHVQIDRAA